MAAKLFLSGEDSPREWFGFGLLCRLCGLSFSLRCGATRRTSPPSPAGAGGFCVFVLCQMGLVPPFPEPGWTLPAVLREAGGAGLDGTSRGALCWGLGREDISEYVGWERFLLQAFHCWLSTVSHIAWPMLTHSLLCCRTGFWGHLQILFVSLPLVFFPFNIHYSYYFYHLLQCISHCQVSFNQTFGVCFPRSLRTCWRDVAKALHSKGPPIPGVWMWFDKDFGNRALTDKPSLKVLGPCYIVREILYPCENYFLKISSAFSYLWPKCKDL